MSIFNRMIVFFYDFGQPTATGAAGQSSAIDGYAIAEAAQKTAKNKSVLLESLYKWAFNFYKTFLDMMQFPRVTKQGVIFDFGNGKTQGDFQFQWHHIWALVKSFFDSLLEFTIPIATVFFIIAIYKSVISKPADEQAKELVVNVIRYAVILVVSLHLFEIMEWFMKLMEDITFSFYSGHKQTNKDFFNSGLGTINAALNGYEPPSVWDLFQGKFRPFCDSIFTYVLYFLGGLLTLYTFVSSGYSMLMVSIHRIFKPIMMVPFSTIILGIGTCSGEGDRMLWRFFKNLLGLGLSGVFILIALKIGSYIEGKDLFANLTTVAGKSSEAKAIVALININIPVVLTTGLVKSADSFMGKIF
ncbi:MAG: hypothetical protein K5769_07100 [Pseudobutyrivibrio sp.]|nr:hypothetical protein [Pseudobutyrivibrio sp.]